ncbi:hypothetical protein QBC45DRAFT_398400 [Copromyces sp. CBS 386.78]|nr:hypothetical protein QBC45DRAFT_398400 [Copromyces sp. CBS 386.78]
MSYTTMEPFLKSVFWKLQQRDTEEAKRARRLTRHGLPADPPYRDFYQESWGSYTQVSYDHYRELRDEGMLPDEKVLLFREPGAIFYRPPPPPTLTISPVQTVFSIAPSSVGASNNHDDPYIAIPKKTIRTAKQQLRAAREALNALDPFVRSAETKIKAHLEGTSLSPVETKTKTELHDTFKTSIKKSASEPPSPKTNEHTCRKCGNTSFRSRNALFDHIYSNTCESERRSNMRESSWRPSCESSNQQSSIITANNTPTPRPPNAPASSGLFTPVKTRPISGSPVRKGNETPLEWKFNSAPPIESSAPRPVTPVPPGAPDLHGSFTPLKIRPLSASLIPWEDFEILAFKPFVPEPLPPLDLSHYKLRKKPPVVTDKVTVSLASKPVVLSPPSSSSQAATPVTPAPQSSNQAATPVSTQPSTPYSCRTCNKSFTSRNLLFAHLRDYSHCRPDKSFRINNTSWRSGKMIQMDFGILGDVISKLTAVASAA